MKKRLFLFVIVLIAVSCHNVEQPFRSAFSEHFLIGVCVHPQQCQVDTQVGKILSENFNSIVAENCMKSNYIQPHEGHFYFAASDSVVNFANSNKQFMVGHCLVWHSQTPEWFFTDSLGNEVSREVMIERMRTHINTIVTHYKGRVQAWDVVNEALNDDGTLRQTPFYRIIGEDYIALAFQFAHEADPKAELYYNDYSMFKPEKYQAAIRLVKQLQAKGLRIDAVGMQGHYLLNDTTPREVELSIEAFAQAGVPIMITEMDLSVLPFPDLNKAGAEISTNFAYEQQMNPYAEKLPAEIAALWESQMLAYFDVFLKHSDNIKRVTFWGLSDSDSWKNDWPMRGRTDYPLLYDRNYTPKPVIEKIKQAAANRK